MKKKIPLIFIFLIFTLIIVSLSILSYKYFNIVKPKIFNSSVNIASLKVVNNRKNNFTTTYSYFDSFYTFYNKYKLYVIKFGDTLWKIKRKFNLKNYSKIIKLNRLKNPDLIYSGSILKIPEE